MIEIDGSRYSGSGTIVRQAVVFSALTGQPVHLVNARIRRPNPGLRHQHIRVVEAIRQLVDGEAEGLVPGSQELIFRPGQPDRRHSTYVWDIGSAGSTTMLALAVLPVLAFSPQRVQVELRGGLFQDFAPTFYHLQHVVVPLLRLFGVDAMFEMIKPGYVPKGGGIVRLEVNPAIAGLRSVQLDTAGNLTGVWGIALASHLAERRVCARMADAANKVLSASGHRGDIELRNDVTAPQPGAALALFADLGGGARLGADRAGALRRPAEAIGQYAARQLLSDLNAGATLDRYAADQVIPFAALASGESRFRVPGKTDHVVTNGWLAELFLGARVAVRDRVLTIEGTGYSGRDT